MKLGIRKGVSRRQQAMLVAMIGTKRLIKNLYTSK
jgi:hypothetical protein